MGLGNATWDKMGLGPSHVKRSLEPERVQSDRELVAAFLEVMDGYSGREISQMVPGITDNDVSRWRRGEWSRLTAAKRRAIRRYLDLQPLRVREVPPEYGGQEELDLLGADFDQIVRFLHGIPGTPEQAKLRKLDALEGLRRFLTARGPLPDRWYQLKEMVERGEI